jgi:hypothetical protein
MLSKAKTLKGYTLDSLDGEIGKVNEFYFDDHHYRSSWNRFFNTLPPSVNNDEKSIINKSLLQISKPGKNRLGILPNI